MLKLSTRLLPDCSDVIQRFTVPVTVCVILFLYNVGKIEDVFSVSRDENLKIYLAAGGAFLASGGMHLFGQGRGLSQVATVLLAALTGLTAFTLGYFDQALSVTMLFLLPGLALWIMIAGFLRPGVPYNAVWLFNVKFGTSVVLATLAGCILAGGLSAILFSLKYLFGIQIGSDAYGHTWNFAIVVVGPLYGMALLPRKLDEELDLSRDTELMQRGLSVLVKYILVPVLLVYVVILHTYAIKIGFSFALPKGQVATMVLLFGISGTAIWLVAKPWVETGSRALKLFSRYWYWFTIVPTGLLVIAAWQRVAEYGMTSERYGLFLIAFWLAVLVLYFAVSRNKARPQFILGSIAVLLVISSFGPWGARSVSISSQLARFEVLLTQKGYLQNSRVVDDVPEVAETATVRAVKSHIEFFRRQKRLDILQTFFDGQKDNPFSGSARGLHLARKIEARLAIGQSIRANETRITFYRNSKYNIKLAGPAELSGPFRLSDKKGLTTFANGIKVNLDKHGLTLEFKDRTYKLDNRQILSAAKLADETQNLKIRIAADHNMWLLVSNVKGILGEKRAKIHYLTGWVVLPDSSLPTPQSDQ